MKNKGPFAISIALLIVAGLWMLLVLVGWVDTGIFVGPLRLAHWAGIMGAGFVAAYTPIFAFLRRRRPQWTKQLLRIHVFGSLIAFILVSIHFAGQLSRWPAYPPEWGEGIVLFVVMVILVASGLVYRFQLTPAWLQERLPKRMSRSVHVSAALAFYVTVAVHAFLNAGIG